MKLRRRRTRRRNGLPRRPVSRLRRCNRTRYRQALRLRRRRCTWTATTAALRKQNGPSQLPDLRRRRNQPGRTRRRRRRRGTPRRRVSQLPRRRTRNCDRRYATAAKRPGVATRPSASKEPAGTDAAKRPEAVARSAAPAPTAQGGAQLCRATPAAPRPGPRATASDAPRSHARSRAIPAAAKRQVWERDQGCCSYVDRDSGRRCGSRHRLQIDHVLPYALGGSAEPDNLRLLCAAHHRHRHSDGRGRADRAARS